MGMERERGERLSGGGIEKKGKGDREVRERGAGK